MRTVHSVSIEKGAGLTKASKTLPPDGNVLLCPLLVKTTPVLVEAPLSIMTLGHMEINVPRAVK